MSIRTLALIVFLISLAASAYGCPADEETTGTGNGSTSENSEGSSEDEASDLEPTEDVDPATLENPIIPDIESVSRGEEIYNKTCITCHGEGGAGDGSASDELEVNPANLVSKPTQDLSDGELFFTITNGREGTPMPAWKGGITPEDRWNLVNYIRTLTGEAEPDPTE